MAACFGTNRSKHASIRANGGFVSGASHERSVDAKTKRRLLTVLDRPPAGADFCCPFLGLKPSAVVGDITQNKGASIAGGRIWISRLVGIAVAVDQSILRYLERIDERE